MLFDLQSPGRRRVVRIVFGGLAIVFAISFVFLGVGTGGGGFSFSDLFGGGSSSSSSTAFDGDIEAAQKQLQVNPSDTTALANLVRLQYSAANANTDSNGAPTSDGEQHLRQAADAWNKYVKATKGNLSATAAVYALNTFDLLARLDFTAARGDTTSTEALADINSAVSSWRSAAQAQQVLIDKKPNKATSNSYATLAQYLYLAGDTQGADPGRREGEAGKGGQPLDDRQPAQADPAARPAAPDGDQAAHEAAAADSGRHRRGRDRWGRDRRRRQPAQRARHRRPQRRHRRALSPSYNSAPNQGR